MSTTNFDLFFTHSESSQNLGAKRGRKPKAEKEKETPKRPKSRSETVLWCTVRAKSTGNDELWQKGQIICINNLQSRGMCNSRGQKSSRYNLFCHELLWTTFSSFNLLSFHVQFNSHLFLTSLHTVCSGKRRRQAVQQGRRQQEDQEEETVRRRRRSPHRRRRRRRSLLSPPSWERPCRVISWENLVLA